MQTPTAVMHLIAFILFLVVGALDAFWALAVHSCELIFYSDLSPLPLTATVREYIESETYVWQVRAAGVACLIAAGVFPYVLQAQWLRGRARRILKGIAA